MAVLLDRLEREEGHFEEGGGEREREREREREINNKIVP